MNLLDRPSGRKALFAVLYFAEGAPIGFLWWALPTILNEEGAPLDRITEITALLVLPWALKFLWAPLVDVLRGPRWTLRAWIVTSQIAMAATLVPLLWIDPRASMGLVVVLLVAHALAAATQDVAIDALAIATTGADERGSINGWMQAGMLLGRSAFGGGALVARRYVGDEAVVALLVASIALTACVCAGFRAPEARAGSRGFLGSLRRAARRRGTWLGLLFAAAGGAGFEAVGAVRGPFLLELGLRSDTIGWFFAVPSVACLLCGALAGGWLSDRLGRRPCVAGSSALMAVAILALAAGTEPLAMLSILYLGIGIFTASSYALLMDLTDPQLGSTQFSAFMGATNLCEAWAGYTVGQIAVGQGYPVAFVVMALVSLLALPLLAWMDRRNAVG